MWTQRLVIILALFLVLGAIGVLVSVLLEREAFFEHVWKRHYNPWSWYVRFFFSFVLYIGVWLHAWAVILLSIACLATCSFWFPVPKDRNTFIAHAVNGEVLWKRQPWTIRKAVPLVVIGPLCLVGLWALWEHSLPLALACLGAMTLYKLWWLRVLSQLSRRQGRTL